MKKLLIFAVALLIGCAGAPIKEVDVCEEIRDSVTIGITVLESEKDWEVYFTDVGRKLAYNMRVGNNDRVEVSILHALTNQEIKGYFTMEEESDGWYTIETLCEYTQGEVTDSSIGVRKKLTPTLR